MLQMEKFMRYSMLFFKDFKVENVLSFPKDAVIFKILQCRIKKTFKPNVL